MCYYQKNKKTKQTKKRLNCFASSMSPAELLKGLNLQLFYPENHAAIIGIKREEHKFINKTSTITGYNENCCSYMLSDIGANIQNKYLINEWQAPDLIVYNTNQCIEIKHWLLYYAEKYKVPAFGIETPHCIEKNNTTVIESIKKQQNKLIKSIENHFDIQFDKQLFQEVLKNSIEISKYWQKIHELTKNNPSPLNFFDLCIKMGPAVTQRGEKETVQYYQKLLEEIQSKKIKAINHKQYRLLWCGLPVWGRLRYMSNFFNSLNACIVNSTYTSSWIFNMDIEDPLTSIAKTYTELFINLTEEEKFKYLSKMIQEWNIDGILFHHSLSCKRNCDNIYGLSKKLKETLNIPSITFEADHNILKHFNKRHFTTSVEALIDQIDKKKK
jgi:benzoyl-CoA reductase/2-hydroxyglutaryl-CoA dehydratase subunit BcrC/BadD/HgdB